MTSASEPRRRDETLDAAALKLLTAVDRTQLSEICELLAPVATDAEQPTWIRDALTTALHLLKEATTGATDVDGARHRASALLELVRAAAGPAADVATSSASCALPIESAGEILPQFVAESLDCVEQAEGALLELESNPANTEAVNVVFRSFHTIKSTSAFLGLDAISTLAHDVESLLCGVRDGNAEFTTRIADLSLACADMMRTLLRRAEALEGGLLLEPPVEYFALLQKLSGAPHAPEKPSPFELLETAPAAAPAGTASTEHAPVSATENWVRVRTERLDQLLDLMGELVVAHSMTADDDAVQQDRHGPLARKVQQTGKIVRRLQDLSMSLRMVPLRSLFQKMQRLVRDVAHTANKPVQLVTDGEETELDRNMVELLTDPLVHMIRNAIDHGIESAAERASAGKQPEGTLQLSAAHVGGSVVVTLSDDGRGLDDTRIVASAVEKGIIAGASSLSTAEIHELIFEPGLSTRSDVSELSGRGVGMDVVRRNIEALHGRVEIASTFGRGTTFTIRLPLTLAITEGMLVRAGGEHYILPTSEIQTSFRPHPENLATAGGDAELVMLHGHALPIVRLHHVLAIEAAITEPTRGLLVVLGDNEKRYALLVDDLLGQQQFVAKPITTGMPQVAGIAGGAILGDGRVGLILDPTGLMAAARRRPPWAHATATCTSS